jgi:hypothetical protein
MVDWMNVGSGCSLVSDQYMETILQRAGFVKWESVHVEGQRSIVASRCAASPSSIHPDVGLQFLQMKRTASVTQDRNADPDSASDGIAIGIEPSSLLELVRLLDVNAWSYGTNTRTGRTRLMTVRTNRMASQLIVCMVCCAG